VLFRSCSIGGAPKGGPFAVAKPPEALNWERWQGQTPEVEYRQKRCHYQFRWWYEYSGGKMTDWGAHHVDIAQWAIGMDDSGPYLVKGTATHPVPFDDKGYPPKDDQFNTATAFNVKALFKSKQHGDIEMTIRHDAADNDDPKIRKQRKNGILFTGEKGEIFVNRGGGSGKFNGEALTVTKEQLAEIYKTDMKPDHYQNWLNCIKSRNLPVSDVFSHHRHLTTCHLANIAIRMNRELKWDPKTQQINGDDVANAMLKRNQRAPYQIKVPV